MFIWGETYTLIPHHSAAKTSGPPSHRTDRSQSTPLVCLLLVRWTNTFDSLWSDGPQQSVERRLGLLQCASQTLNRLFIAVILVEAGFRVFHVNSTITSKHFNLFGVFHVHSRSVQLSLEVASGTPRRGVNADTLRSRSYGGRQESFETCERDRPFVESTPEHCRQKRNWRQGGPHRAHHHLRP